jgi:integrase/recombinase XerC
MRPWLEERRKVSTTLPSLLLTRTGTRPTTRALDLIVRRLGDAAGLKLSAHVLRHSMITRLVRAGNDPVMVAELAGHGSVETTRRYSLPSQQDRADAVSALEVEV